MNALVISWQSTRITQAYFERIVSCECVCVWVQILNFQFIEIHFFFGDHSSYPPNCRKQWTVIFAENGYNWSIRLSIELFMTEKENGTITNHKKYGDFFILFLILIKTFISVFYSKKLSFIGLPTTFILLICCAILSTTAKFWQILSNDQWLAYE